MSVRIALVDSGFGLLATAAALRRSRPDAHLVLSMDPEHMPWGPRSVAEITRRALAGAAAALEASDGALDALVIACNTASVHALNALRSEFEPQIPVVGTVPAIKPAADQGRPVAIWATPATTGSDYQRDLIARFARGVPVTPVACPGLAEAVESVHPAEIGAAVASAAERTPGEVGTVVLGCTHYELVREEIRTTLGGEVELYGSAEAVAAQTLRRLAASPLPQGEASGGLTVLCSGHRSRLPQAACHYADGALLAHPATASREPL